MTMQDAPEFSIVFPVLNQEDHIERVIRAYHAALQGANFSFELIPVVNGTTDRSYAICQQLERTLPEVRAFRLQGAGYGLGILHGLAQAKGKYLGYLNCARITAEDLLMCLRRFQTDPGAVVHGVRVQRDVKQRTVLSVGYSTLCRLIFRLKTSDVNGNPNFFSRTWYEKFRLRSTDSMIDVELQDNVGKADAPLIEVPIHSYRRHGGISTTTFWTTFRLLKEGIRYWWRTRILKNDQP